jgi:hypothetical protein
MAKGQSITEEARTFGSGDFRAHLAGDPLTHIQEQVQKNIHKVTRALKQEMVDMMKKRNKHDGADGTGYTKEYAAKKSRMTGRPYSGGQPYDYKWSGQLMSALEGRGRAKPSQGTMDVWVGFRRNNRRPIQKTPGSNPRRRRTISNKRLAEILTNGLGEVDKPARAPFAIHREEHPRLIRKTALALMNNEYD